MYNRIQSEGSIELLKSLKSQKSTYQVLNSHILAPAQKQCGVLTTSIDPCLLRCPKHIKTSITFDKFE